MWAPQWAILCVDVKQGGKKIGRSSLVAGKWGDLFFGSFPVKFPGDRDTEKIYLCTRTVLHTVEERAKRGGRDSAGDGNGSCWEEIKKERGREVECQDAGAISVFCWHHAERRMDAQQNQAKTRPRLTPESHLIFSHFCGMKTPQVEEEITGKCWMIVYMIIVDYINTWQMCLEITNRL